jgi:hypothetical protein
MTMTTQSTASLLDVDSVLPVETHDAIHIDPKPGGVPR